MSFPPLSPLDEAFRQLYRQQEGFDTLLITDNGEKKLKVHSIMLVAYFPALRAKIVKSEDPMTRVLKIEGDDSLFFRYLVEWIYERGYHETDDYKQHVGESRAKLNIGIYGMAMQYELPFLQQYVISLLKHCWDEKSRGDNGCFMINLLESIGPICKLGLDHNDALVNSLLDRVNAIETESPAQKVLFKDYQRSCLKFWSYRLKRKCNEVLSAPGLRMESPPARIHVTSSDPASTDVISAGIREHNRRVIERLGQLSLQ